MEERQKDYTIMEGCTIPSLGKIYGEGINPQIELRAMTGRDEMKRLAKTNTNFKVMSDIIEGCMIEKPKVHVYDMALADYEYLLHKLRVISYGADYPMTIYCNECNKMSEVTVNLDTLTVREIDVDKFEKDSTIILPDSQDKVDLNFQTPHLLDAIQLKANEYEKKFKQAAVNFETLSKLVLTIHSVNDAKLNDFDLETKLLDVWSAKDIRFILSSIDELNSNFGINAKVTLNCPKCGCEKDYTFLYGPEFLGPTKF